MEKSRKKEEKIYRSMAEVEKDFFPALHEERLVRMRDEDPRGFGIRLAAESLANIGKQLAK